MYPRNQWLSKSVITILLAILLLSDLTPTYSQAILLSNKAQKRLQQTGEAFLVLPYIDAEVRIQKKYSRSTHTGIDYVKDGKDGSEWVTFEVRAAASGYACQVSDKGTNDNLGKIVWIHHQANNKKFRTKYVHLQSVESDIPQCPSNNWQWDNKNTIWIDAGQKIGMAGDTGWRNCRPPCIHLHFELLESKNSTDDWRSLNPAEYFLTNTTQWFFATTSQGWTIGNGLNESKFVDNGWWHRVAGNDPWLLGPTTKVSANDYHYLFILMVSQTDSCGQVYFKTEATPNFDEVKRLDLPIVANGDTQAMFFDMRSNPHWTGNLIQLRLDPACISINDKTVRIDFVMLIRDGMMLKEHSFDPVYVIQNGKKVWLTSEAQVQQYGGWAKIQIIPDGSLYAIPGIAGGTGFAAKHSGQCLDISGASRDNGASVIQWDCHRGSNQQWNLVAVGNHYQIVAKHSGRCLDVSGNSRRNGAQVIQWDCHGRNNQLWSLVVVGDYYQLVAKHSNKCLDVSGGSGDNGARIIQWDCSEVNNQLWRRSP